MIVFFTNNIKLFSKSLMIISIVYLSNSLNLDIIENVFSKNILFLYIQSI